MGGKARVVRESKACEWCGDEFMRRVKERFGDYAKRRSCSRKCNIELRAESKRETHRHHIAQKSLDRKCEVCGCMFPIGTTSVANHMARKTCGKGCQHRLSALARSPLHYILGVQMTRQQCAEMIGVSRETITHRVRRGQSLLTGKPPKP